MSSNEDQGRTGIAEVSRRDLLRMGGAGLLSAILPSPLKSVSSLVERVRVPDGKFGAADKFLFVFLQGGPSHIDLWDPKPDAPAHVRGEFKAIRSRVTGIWLTETMPKLARVIDRATLIRSCSYSPAGIFKHSAAIYEVLTGYPPDDCPVDGQLDISSRADSPSIGAHISRLLPSEMGTLQYAILPRPIRESQVVGKGTTGGFYGSPFDPCLLVEGPVHQLQSFQILQGPVLYEDISNPTRRALDVHHEPERLMDAYGRNSFGASLLAARRLLEAGSRVVQVNWPARANGDPRSDSLDTHRNNFQALKRLHGPKLDMGLAALLEDMDTRGLLKETVVLVMGEFGRSPRLGVSTSGNANSPDGRDHWPYCFTAMMAGGGIARGAVYGESDANGAYPVDKAVHPARLLATVYYALGIRPDTSVTDQQGRTNRLVSAEPITELLG